MTETQAPPEEQVQAEGDQAELQSVVSKLDDDGSNPFWPKGAGGAGQPDNPNLIQFVSVTFDQANSATVNVTIKTTPVDQAWTINWGDGSADVPIAAATNVAQHTYADKTSGKAYTIKIINGTDTDTRKVQY